MSEQRKAAVLVSGGLDSMLAVKVLQEQGVHVEGINFYKTQSKKPRVSLRSLLLHCRAG